MHFFQILADWRLCTECSAKGAAHCSFLERFKATTLGKSYWKKLSMPGKICLSIAFLLESLLTVSYIQGAVLLLSYSPLKMLLRENPTDTFYQYLEYYLNITFLPNITQTLHFSRIFTDKRLSTRYSMKGTNHFYFHRVL